MGDIPQEMVLNWTTESSFIIATVKRIMTISPFFVTSKYFSSCSLPVVFVDMVPLATEFSEKVAIDIKTHKHKQWSGALILAIMPQHETKANSN